MEIYKYKIQYNNEYAEFLTIAERTQFINDNHIVGGLLSEGMCTIPESPINPIVHIQQVVGEAMDFGKELTLMFCAENVILGITQAGMTDKVRAVLDAAFRALETGSLYEALNKMKAVDDADKDGIFVSDDRIIKYLNKIEDYLNIARTVTI